MTFIYLVAIWLEFNLYTRLILGNITQNTHTHTSSDKPPDVSFNPPTYEEATTTGNVYWNPAASAPNIAADIEY